MRKLHLLASERRSEEIYAICVTLLKFFLHFQFCCKQKNKKKKKEEEEKRDSEGERESDHGVSVRRDHCSKFLLTLAKVSLVGNSAIVKTDHGPRAVTFNLLLSDKLSACARFFFKYLILLFFARIHLN